MTLKQITIAILLVVVALVLSFCISPSEESAPNGQASKPAAQHDSAHKGHGVSAQNLEISSAWTRATVESAKVGGGYITIKNTGDEADRLIAASADFTNGVELHEMTLVDDVMRMRPLEGGISIPAGGEVTLKPGGQHLMFIGLKQPLVEGGKVPVSLTFEKAGDVFISFKINGLAAKSADEHGAHEGH